MGGAFVWRHQSAADCGARRRGACFDPRRGQLAVAHDIGFGSQRLGRCTFGISKQFGDVFIGWYVNLPSLFSSPLMKFFFKAAFLSEWLIGFIFKRLLEEACSLFGHQQLGGSWAFKWS